jgi:hypothetical protein
LHFNMYDVLKKYGSLHTYCRCDVSVWYGGV